MMMGIRKLCNLPVGLIFLGLGISSLIYTPMDIIFNIRLRMLPGFLPYELWHHPPENVLLHVYFFNVTNSEEFLNGTDDEIHVEEIGPIFFRETLSHDNVVFNENSTLSYTVKREPVYLPEMNSINMNDTVITFNLAILTIASYMSDAPFFVRAAISMLMRKYNSQPFQKTTIYNYLMNSTDPLLETAKNFAGARVIPSTNVGCLSQMFLEKQHNLTVFIGPKYGHHEFFTIDKFDGYDHISVIKRCPTKFINASEPTAFPQFLEKGQSLKLWRSILCKVIDLNYINETSNYGLTVKRYEVPLDLFNRTEPAYLDCWKGNPELPNGVSDISACNRGLPLVASFPHFLNSDPVVTNRIKGFNAGKEKHDSFLQVEKFTGVILRGRAAFQINLHVRKLSYNKEINRFSNMFIPTSYVILEAQEQPWYILTVIYSFAVIIPKCQLLISVILLGSGLLLLYSLYLEFRKPKTILLSNIDEKEIFLK